MAAAGSERGILSWLVLQGGPPYLGGIVLLATMIIVAWKRHLTMSGIVTILVALITIWPYFWRIGLMPMAYPITLEETVPAATVRLPSNEPPLVAWGGDSPRVNYHVTFPDARWA